MRKGRGAFADQAVRYATQVVAGDVPACWQIRRACERFLGHVSGEQWTYDAGLVEWACSFLQLLPLLDGENALMGRRLVLQPFQIWIVANLIGLTDAAGLRKYREGLVMMPRKGGKSTFAAGLSLLLLAADGEPAAQCYIGARNLDQASYCFNPAVAMAQRAPGFAHQYGVRFFKKKLELADGSFLKPLIGNPPDGSNPHFAILDEAHENDNYALQRDTMTTGTGARRQPLVLTITTAGFNEAGPCRSYQAQAEQVLSGELVNEQMFAAIWTIDKNDDWRDFDVWLKANPNAGVSPSVEYLRKQHQTALTVPSQKPTLLTKHLNVWQSSSDAWVDMAAWDANATAPPLDGLANGLRAWIGCDLSRLYDTTAIGLLVEVMVEGRPTYCYYPFLYLPEGAIERQAKNATAYREWAEAGYLTLTQDDETDFGAVKAKLVELCGRFKVEAVAVDQWQAASTSQELREHYDLEVVTYPQNVQNLHPPMSRFEKLLANGELLHDGNKMLRWQVGNVVAQRKGELLKPTKPPRRPEAKIDGFVSLMMALGVASVAPAKPAEVWMDLLD